MSYCPKCRSEYVEGVAECDDCGIELVPALSSERGLESAELVEVWRTYGEMDAQLIRSLLDGNGITCVFSGEALRLTHGLTVDGLGEVKILVRCEDAARARDVIASREGMGRCPRCDQPVEKKEKVCRYCGADLNAANR